MTTRRGRLRTGLFFAIGLAAGGFAILAYGFHVFARLEVSTVDARFSIRGDLATPKDVVVVGVDDITFSELGLQWPFPAERGGQGDRPSGGGGGEGDRGGHPVHGADDADAGLRRALCPPCQRPGRGARGVGLQRRAEEREGRALDDRGRERRKHEHPRRPRSRARCPRCERQLHPRCRRRDPALPVPDRRARDVPVRRSRARARPSDRPLVASRPAGVDRLHGPAGGDPVPLVLACPRRQVRSGRRARRDRRRRRDGANRAGRPPDLDLRRQRDVGRRDPGERDPHGAARLPACGTGRRG